MISNYIKIKLQIELQELIKLINKKQKITEQLQNKETNSVNDDFEFFENHNYNRLNKIPINF